MTGSTTAQNSFVSLLQSVEQLISKSQLKEAAHQLNALSKIAPSDPRLFLLGSVLAEASHNVAGMLTAAKKAVSLSPGWPVATIRLAGVLAAVSPTAQALEMAQQAITEATQQQTLNAEILSKAAGVAVHCKQYDQGVKWSQQAHELEPQNLQFAHQLGEAYAYNGQFEEAVETYSNALKVHPGQSALLFDRMLAFINTKQTKSAIKDVKALLAQQPDNSEYQYYRDLLNDETPVTQPASVVKRLFDESAAEFDEHLVVNLKYNLPNTVAAMITEWYPAKDCDILDLGCGTGLLGAHLGTWKAALVGVDLSTEMIAKAAQRNVYHQFNNVNVLDALQATAGDYYDVLTALDVLIYVGDLSAVIPNAHRILTQGGRFVFSCETGASNGPKYNINAAGRYVHQQSYVSDLLTQAGYAHTDIKETTLRFEAGQPVKGFVVVAQK